jgi:SAM-dependent methyltransferase
MCRNDLFTDAAAAVVADLNRLILDLYARDLHMTSWYGTFPKDKKRAVVAVGIDNRGPDYEPLTGAADDNRLPWYLYWEIVWVLSKGPALSAGARLLDAGGTASLFTCYLASLGYDMHSVDLNEKLVAVGNTIAKAMGWRMHSYAMNMMDLDFPDDHFDHAYSICVFEHLTQDIKRGALREIARVLKPGGVLSITFDYKNPAPFMMETGPSTAPENQISSASDIRRCFLDTDCFQPMGNPEFYDNGKSYLVHPGFDNAPYSFGAIFLRKK